MELNRLTWEKDRLPFGLSPIAKDRWSYGILPERSFNEVRQQIAQHVAQRKVRLADRDDRTDN